MANKWFVRFLSVLLLANIFLPVTSHEAYAVNNNDYTHEYRLKVMSESYNKVVEIEGSFYLYFAQNSPEWGGLSTVQGSNVRQSICAPTSLANVLVNSVPMEDLNVLLNMVSTPIRIDTMSINPVGIRSGLRFNIERCEDLLRFLPLCITNIQLRPNNTTSKVYTKMSYYDNYLDALSLNYTKSSDIEVCIQEIIDSGAYVIACTGGASSPIAPNNGHYLTLIHADDEYIYMLDSIFRDSYQYDKKNIIEILEPGVIRVKRENLSDFPIGGVKYIVYPRVFNQYTPEDYSRILEISNMRSSVTFDEK